MTHSLSAAVADGTTRDYCQAHGSQEFSLVEDENGDESIMCPLCYDEYLEELDEEDRIARFGTQEQMEVLWGIRDVTAVAE